MTHVLGVACSGRESNTTACKVRRGREGGGEGGRGRWRCGFLQVKGGGGGGNGYRCVRGCRCEVRADRSEEGVIGVRDGGGKQAIIYGEGEKEGGREK